MVALLVGGLAALAPLLAEAGIFRATSLPRSTVDRPDDFAGLQVHVIYAVPSDGVDRAFDTSGGIESSTASYQTWLAGQTGGRTLRFDTHQGSLDITFQRLPRPDAEYVARGRGARDLIEQDLRASGLVTWQKVYPVYYDGANDLTCGGASWPPALPGTVFAFYLRSVIPGLVPCFASGFAEAGEPPRYTEFAVLHDFMHDLGIVGPCSPHFWDAGHVNENPNDLMWSGTGSWTPSILDVGRDDYFQAHIAGCPDLDTSGFLTSDADFALTVSKIGSGTGTVTSSPWALVDCGSTCSAPYGRGTVVALTARPEGESTFVGWGAPCAGTGPCSVTVDAAKTVTAQFKAPDREVVVETLGSGQGTVTSAPAGLRCPPACATTFPGQSRLELRASLRLGPGLLGADVLVHARSGQVRPGDVRRRPGATGSSAPEPRGSGRARPAPLPRQREHGRRPSHDQCRPPLDPHAVPSPRSDSHVQRPVAHPESGLAGRTPVLPPRLRSLSAHEPPELRRADGALEKIQRCQSSAFTPPGPPTPVLRSLRYSAMTPSTSRLNDASMSRP
jgi:hypothetical protein